MKAKKKVIWIKRAIGILAVIGMLGGTANLVYAETETHLMQSIVSGDKINLYISNLDTYTEAEGQIGRDVVEIVGVENDVPGRTVFLIDNSNPSITSPVFLSNFTFSI